MGIKDKFENHWLVISVAVAVASASLTAGVMAYFSVQRGNSLQSEHRLEIKQLKRNHKTATDELTQQVGAAKAELTKQLAAADAQLTHERKRHQDELTFYRDHLEKDGSFDLHSIIKERSEAVKPEGTTDYDTFYAPASVDPWNKVEDGSLLPSVYRPSSSQTIQTLIQMLESFPATKVHRWIGDEPLAVGESKVLANVYPYISVQGAATADWQTGLVSFWRLFGNALRFGDVLDIDPDVVVASMKNLSEEDIAQMIFLYEFAKRELVVIEDSSIRFTTVSLKKQDKSFYARFLTTYHDISLGEIAFNKYYVREQLMVLPAGENIFVVKTFVPSEEELGKHQFDAWEWLKDFRIVKR